jgi:thiol-disulfide isomerase/thioredoxin
MPKKTKSNYVDLRSPGDLPMFNKLLKTFEKKGIYILVHADFCGPCQKYKASVWDHLVNNKNRKAGMAAIHYDQLENSPFSNAKIQGYPSVLYVTQNGTVKTVSNFKSDGNETTNAMPSDTMHNKELMETLINSDPKDVQKLVPSMELIDNVNNLSSNEPSDNMKNLPSNEPTVIENDQSNIKSLTIQKTPPFSDATSKLRSIISGNMAIKNMSKPDIPSNKGTPPRAVLLDSQEKENPTILDFTPDNKKPVDFTPDNKKPVDFNPTVSDNEPTPGKGTAVGGTLYSFLKSTRSKSRRAYIGKKKVHKKHYKVTAKKQKLR